MIDYEIFYEQFCNTISHTIYNNNRNIHICFILNIVNMYKRIILGFFYQWNHLQKVKNSLNLLFSVYFFKYNFVMSKILNYKL